MSNRLMRIRTAPRHFPSIIRLPCENYFYEYFRHGGAAVHGYYSGLFRLRSGQVVRAFPPRRNSAYSWLRP